MVVSEVFHQYSSSTGKVAVALIRIKNITSEEIIWPLSFYYTAYGGWSESAGVALNGSNVATYTASGNTTVNLSIPPNRTSTIIVSSASGQPHYVDQVLQRSCILGFYNNCLQLPEGLEFVDDLDYASGGWDF